ncbi:MAG: hypothetical protein A2776_01860 [Candidatus Levybacteria bacterium RIFCSPHIGHO2_01_FULL_40_10]|nr:MAG: hypothetical protein A2776_01860 [Candidatus Levybacteria bacterium RIFCSPHIGHO2_01_FULL_40_10]
MLNLLIPPFFFSCAITLIFTPLTIALAKKLKLVDDPKLHKHPAVIHKKTLPRAGGLPVYLAILIASLIFLPTDRTFIAIFFAGLLVVVIGLLDDRFDLSPYLRFIGNIVCASIVVFSGLHIPFITNPLGGILNFANFSFSFLGLVISLPVILAIFWIVWVMNMLNWSKGVDGQMPGIAVVSALIIGIASLRFATLNEVNIIASQASFIVAGASLGFLFYNFYPAKIFPGYSATILGFMLGVLSIMSGVKLATAVLVMGVPTADFLFIFIRRILSHRSPFKGDNEHLHHLLLKVGVKQRTIAIIYWLMSLLLGMFAFTLSSRGKLFAIILVLVIVGFLIWTLRFLIKRSEIE